MFEHITLGFFVGMTLYILFVNWCLIKVCDMQKKLIDELTETLAKASELLTKINE